MNWLTIRAELYKSSNSYVSAAVRIWSSRRWTPSQSSSHRRRWERCFARLPPFSSAWNQTSECSSAPNQPAGFTWSASSRTWRLQTTLLQRESSLDLLSQRSLPPCRWTRIATYKKCIRWHSCSSAMLSTDQRRCCTFCKQRMESWFLESAENLNSLLVCKITFFLFLFSTLHFKFSFPPNFGLIFCNSFFLQEESSTSFICFIIHLKTELEKLKATARDQLKATTGDEKDICEEGYSKLMKSLEFCLQILQKPEVFQESVTSARAAIIQ